MKIALGCMLAIDAALGVVNWRAANEAPLAQAQQRAMLTQKAQLLATDVRKGHEIDKRLPNVTQECEEFYQKDLLPSSSGDTSVISDIVQMAKSAGVETSGVAFHEAELKERGLKEAHVSVAVQGDYQSLIRLIDGIERSPHFYLLDQLMLTSENSGIVRLQVNLRTYFRT